MKKLVLASLLLAVSLARAEIVIGVSVSTTGPGTSLGVPVANTFGILPKTIGGEPVRYVLADDTSDPTAGARLIRRFATDDKVDAIIGSSTVPVAIAEGGVAGEARIPLIALCPIPIDPAKQTFVFAVPQPVILITDAAVEHMRRSNVKNVGYIGFSDAFGDLAHRSLLASTKAAGMTVVGNERYARNDTSVSAQVLKVLSLNPDVIFVGGAGTASALPQIAALERGYRKQIYHPHGVVNQDFIRVGGKAVEGAIAPTGPVVVAEQLPADHPLRAPGLEFLKQYEGRYGANSRNAFAAYAWDAVQILTAAVPVALKRAKPGTAEFRLAMREAIEGVKELRGTHAVYSMSPTDHYGSDKRAVVLVRVENGAWKLVP